MDKYARFEAWLRENGAKFEQLELCEYETDGARGKSSKTNKQRNHVTKLSSSLSSSFRVIASACGGGGGGGEEKKETTTSSIDDDEDDDLVINVAQPEEEESEMRGIHAKTHIAPNTVCMSIPRRCLITVEMGQATSIGQAIYHSDLDLDAPKHIYLMIYILWDRKVHGSSSFFAPYYDTLPKTLNNMPIFWTPEELAELQGSYLLHQIADRNQAIADDYYSICAVAPSLRQICTLNEFKWARMCVCSRNFGLQIDGHRTSALVPHADMLNHYRPRETKWTFDEEQNAFTITTLQHIPAGAQVYDSYGQKCNHRFLLNYGFAVEDNREIDGFCPNEVPLELSVDPNDENYAEKMEFWTRGEVSHHNGHHQQQQTEQQNNHHFTANKSNGGHPSSTLSTSNSNGLHNSSSTSSNAQQQQSQWSSRGTGRSSSAAGRRYNSAKSSSSHISSSLQQQPQLQHPTPRSGSSSSSSTSSSSSSTPSTTMKRVRVCVSNNENTRLLFSLLRALACNEDELRAIRAPLSSSSSFTFHSNHHNNNNIGTNYNDSATATSLSSSLIGSGMSSNTLTSHLQPLDQDHYHELQREQHYQYSHILSGTPTPLLTGSAALSSSSPSFFRSCRDIRHPISIRNERAALRLLLDLVSQHLARYPTTLAQDSVDLLNEQAYPRFSNRRHAKIQVKGEKEILHHFAAWAKTGLDVLQVIERDLTALEQQWIEHPQDEQTETEQQQQPRDRIMSHSSSINVSHSGVEVKLTRSGQTITDESSLCSPPSNWGPVGRGVGGVGGFAAARGGTSLWSSTPPITENFDALIRRMEEASNNISSSSTICSSHHSNPAAAISASPYGDNSHHHHSYSSNSPRRHHHHHHRLQASFEEDEEEDSLSSLGFLGSNINHEVHHTILRYCADVLGSLMREEVKNLKHRLRWRAASRHNNSNNNNNNHPSRPEQHNYSGPTAMGRGGGRQLQQLQQQHHGRAKTPRK